MSLAPIALFVYNRLSHTRLTVEALQRNKHAPESDLIVYSDAPKTADQREAVNEVRDYFKGLKGFKTVRLVERDENHGLMRSIISGVSDVVAEYGKIIVMEDDLVSSPYFLQYMNDALDFYVDEERVISIHGYCYPVSGRLPPTFFLRGADCWGWATWERGWALFSQDGPELLRQLLRNKLSKEFDLDGAYPYTRMLRRQIEGKNRSWAILWYASAFLLDKLTLYPGRSLICNIGNDNSGTHSICSTSFDVQVDENPVVVEHIPISASQNALREFERYMKSRRLKRALAYLSRLLRVGR